MPYEDIKIRTQRFAVEVIRLSREFKKNKVDFALVDQFLRSGTSIGANVREAKASSTKKELIRFYEIALRSANETEYWIEVIEEGYELKIEKNKIIKAELVEISNVIGKIIINLKR
ncbi:MAG: four helix bundle protein [Bacteroidia bacterium]